MKIVKLTAENVKRLRAVEITPDGNLVVVAGKNGQGKTSVLDAIWMALGGGPAARGTVKPIRNGETTAKVTLDLGELVVTRQWTGDNTTLRVESKDGAQFRSPQAMLDSLVGRLSFDPLTFAQQDARSQLTALLDLVDLPFDPDELAAERARLYDERTAVGRVAKQLDGQIAGLEPVPDGTPSEEVDVAALHAEDRAAWEAGGRYADAERELLQLRRDRDRVTSEIAETRRRLDELTSRGGQLDRDVTDAAASIVAMAKALPDREAIQKRLTEAQAVNVAVRARLQREEVTARAAAEHAKYDALTDEIDALDSRKADALTVAAMPIDGLGFDDTGVTYRGVPFKQCSAAEQLRVSLAMAMAMNPKVRVVRITDGSLLDSDNMQLIETMAADQDYQVWIERVDESGAVGIVIEDGAVAGGDS